MYIGSSVVQECIAFLGYEDPNAPGGIKPEGTGFLLDYQGFGYLVTVRHIATRLGGDPFCIRINRPDGGVTFELMDNVTWLYHPDSSVDLAAFEYNPVGEERLHRRYVHWSMLLTEHRVRELDIQPGCVCYVVGLFRFIQGSGRNLPLVFTGNIASLDTKEAVPVYDLDTKQTELCTVYLIEAHGIDGLSGSPVFARQTRSLTYPTSKGSPETVLVASNNLDLLGVFMGAWFLPPDQAVALTYRVKAGQHVPVGVGMVIPSQRLVELMELPAVKGSREAVTNGVWSDTRSPARTPPGA